MQRDEFDNQIEISAKTSGSKWVREKSVLHGSAESLDTAQNSRVEKTS